MYQIQDQGFTFDVGPTIVMMPELYKDVFRLSGVNPDNYLSFELLNPLYTVYFKDKTKLSVSSQLTDLIQSLESFSEKEAEGYLAYLADVYKRYHIAKHAFLDISYRKPSEFFNLKSLINLLRLKTLNTAYHSISKFVKDEKLRQALSFQTLYIGVSPFAGPSIYTIIPMIELLYGVWYIKGGMYQFAKAMEKRFLEMGGQIHLSESVDSIIIEDKTAKGIMVSNKQILSDIVLTNADFPWAVKHLIKDQKNKGKYQDKKLDKMTYSSSAFILYFGMSKKYPTHVHAIRFAQDFKKNIDDLFESNIPDDPSFYIYSPTQIDDTLAPKDKEIIYVLVPTPSLHHNDINWDEKLITSYKDKMIHLIEEIPGFEDFKAHIEVSHVYTPKTFEKTFNLSYGATFGLRPTIAQSVYFRPQATFKNVKNLYFTGSSTHPGAGVPIVLMSSKLAVESIQKDHAL
jgi:phytoene desaturase